jgi:hypothetical protein
MKEEDERKENVRKEVQGTRKRYKSERILAEKGKEKNGKGKDMDEETEERKDK